MICTNSRQFFEVSIGPQPDNTLHARFLCLKDFLKRCLGVPFTLIGKACKTFFRFVTIPLAVIFVLITLGSSPSAREFFVNRVVILAKDFADWILLPFALILCFLRLILALLIHPNFYFNTL